jgi:hypothetical protein
MKLLITKRIFEIKKESDGRLEKTAQRRVP